MTSLDTRGIDAEVDRSSRPGWRSALGGHDDHLRSGATEGDGAVEAQEANSGSDLPADFYLAAQRLSDDTGIDLADALDRIVRQDDLIEAAEDVEAAVGDAEWGGAFIDHEHEGRLVVQTTGGDPPPVPTTVEGASVVVEDVDHSLAELVAVADQISDQGLPAVTAVDVQANVVEVTPVTSEDALTDPAVLAEEAVESFADEAVVLGAEQAPSEDGLCYQDFTMCSAPLRSGITLYGNTPGPGGASICSSGFNVVSNTDNKPYLLTAGHCVSRLGTRSTPWLTRTPSDNLNHVIGPTHNHADGTIDGAIIRVNNPAGWAPDWRQLVFSKSAGILSTARDHRYPILRSGTHEMIPGGYLCRTGATSHTDCGMFLRPNVNLSDGTRNTGELDMWGCGGDSGAGVFRANRGYGVHIASSGTRAVRGSVNYLIALAAGVECRTRSYYQGLETLLRHFNVRLRGT